MGEARRRQSGAAMAVESRMTDERQSWCKAFEMIGPKTLRLQLGRNEISGEYKREAEKWLLEKDTEAAEVDRKRFQKILWWQSLAVLRPSSRRLPARFQRGRLSGSGSNKVRRGE